MADTHYEVDETLKPARDLMDTLRSLQAAWSRFVSERAVLIQMKDGAASGNAVYAKQASLLGYAGADTATKQAAAAASFTEIDSDYTTANGAITQLLARHLTGG